MRLLITLFLFALPAAADYSMPPAKDTQYLVVDSWKLKGDTLVTPDDRWRVDLFWLADRIASDLICCGDHVTAMRKYLAGLKGPLVAEMVRVDDEYFVASLRPLGPIAKKTKGGEKELRKRSAVARILMDLRLEVKLVTKTKVKRGEAIRFKVTLRNVSKKHMRKIVKPGDGSESGWREPHIFFSAQFGGVKITPNGIGRCGLFDEDWRKDVVDLKPGESIKINDWLAPAHALFRFEKDGKYKLSVHYRYTGGNDDPGRMGKIPAFEVVAEPVEIDVAG